LDDVKGAVLIHERIVEASKKVDIATHGLAQFGQISGVIHQSTRLLAGIIRELLEVVGAYKALIASQAFKGLTKGWPRDAAKAWQVVVATAGDGKARQGADDDLALLVKVRASFGFHYGPKSLAKGFRAFFLDSPPGDYNHAAAFSEGENMEGTRFYFADASVEKGFETLLGIERTVFERRLFELAKHVSIALNSIVIAYLKKHCGPVSPFRAEKRA
jgi:hypothetical protein